MKTLIVRTAVRFVFCVEVGMVEIAELVSEDTLKLPEEIAKRFRPADRFFVWQEGDSLTLKRITPPAILDRVAKTPDDNPMALDEINTLVHEIRKLLDCNWPCVGCSRPQCL